MFDLAGYVICVLIRPKGVLWDLDRGSEKTNRVFEHHFVKPRLCKSRCGNGAVILLEEKLELTDPGQTTRNTPTPLYASTIQLNSGHNAATEETFAGHPPNPDASIRLPDCKARFITPKNSFQHVHSPMTVSFTPLQSILRILWGDVWLVRGCTTMESQVFKLSLDGQSCCC
ncbi:hypothetical protein TNCV_1472321 [Trichonephila clavipes]|nr:hypothetical protein TNCV_1472321 [Trichonephila clavipes]